MTERKEAFMRIIVGIISGIIMGLWKALIQVIAVIHFFYVIFAKKRNKDLAEFSNHWNTAIYDFIRYMTFTTNKRPFPFNPLTEDKDKVEIKTK